MKVIKLQGESLALAIALNQAHKIATERTNRMKADLDDVIDTINREGEAKVRELLASAGIDVKTHEGRLDLNYLDQFGDAYLQVKERNTLFDALSVVAEGLQ